MLDPRHKEGGLATTTRPPQAVPPASSTTESLARLPVGTSTRTVALMGPVKPGVGQTPADCLQAGQAGNGAPRHHEPHHNPSANIGGWRPRYSTQPDADASDQQRRSLSPRSSTPLDR
jgi:hypothetical protein